MNIHRRLILFSVMLALCAGCASVGTEKRLEPGDLPSLAGTWRGWVHTAGVGNRQVEVTIHPDGSFVSTHVADRSEGRITIVDGKVEAQGQVGAYAENTKSTATLYERNGKRILSGTGRSPGGPYSFEYEKVR